MGGALGTIGFDPQPYLEFWVDHVNATPTPEVQSWNGAATAEHHGPSIFEAGAFRAEKSGFRRKGL